MVHSLSHPELIANLIEGAEQIIAGTAKGKVVGYVRHTGHVV
jgi:hypothetical protein